jgi:hypothetical protein
VEFNEIQAVANVVKISPAKENDGTRFGEFRGSARDVKTKHFSLSLSAKRNVIWGTKVYNTNQSLHSRADYGFRQKVMVQ